LMRTTDAPAEAYRRFAFESTTQPR
jgi:hypothetical protein